jgi:hypothetical protein
MKIGQKNLWQKMTSRPPDSRVIHSEWKYDVSRKGAKTQRKKIARQKARALIFAAI